MFFCDRTIYTIGYANKSIDEFILCLKKHGIKYVLDVRSEPYSKRFPDYNQAILSTTLSKHGIRYVWFGDYFGARRDEDEVYVDSYSLDGRFRKQVSFQNVYSTDFFARGVNRIKKALDKNIKVCFMCSEREPVDCHRFWMVAFYFKFATGMVDEVVNIIDENCIKSFEQVINEIDLEKIKKAFYKQHTYEIEGYSLLGENRPLWIEWWSNFFGSAENVTLKKQEYANCLIGYVRGDEEYD